MTIRLDTEAVEKSTFVINAHFTDASGLPATPSSAVWSLMDSGGNIINNRSQQEFSPIGSSVTAVLSGNDLAISGDYDDRIRFFTLKVVYSSTEGINLPLNEEASFIIRGLLGVI